MEWLLTLATAAALFVLFAASETALHHRVPAEATRRLAHVAGAGTAATLPLKVFAAAAILTMVEGTLGYGLDNLLLPVAAVELGQAALGL